MILVGGTTRLPTLSDKLLNIFYPATPLITSQIDPDEVIAKGTALCALSLIQTYPLDSAAHQALHSRAITEHSVVSPSFLAKPLGFLIAAPESDPKAIDGKVFVTLVEGRSPLPLRRVLDVEVPSGSGKAQVLLSLWEGTHEVKVVAPVKKAKASGGFFSRATAPKEDDEDEEDEEDDVRTAIIRPNHAVVDVIVDVDTKVVKKEVPRVRVTVCVDVGGHGSIAAVQLVEGAENVYAEF